MFDSYRWIKAFKRSRAINRVHEAKLPDEGFSDPDQMRNEQFSPTEQRMIKQIMSYKKRGAAMVTLPSRVRDFYFKNKSKIDALQETNIFSADDEQSWPSGPFGKKDDYADESGDSYKRAKDWSPDKPGEDEDTEGTGYKEDQT